MTNLAIWDFDGTLARASSWSAVLHEVVAEASPQSSLSAEVIRPHLSTGFPWHTPERLHESPGNHTAWWEGVASVLAAALGAVGVPASEATMAAREAHRRYVSPARFRLFADSRPALLSLKKEGWRQVILTNHVPEFTDIANALGISSLVDAIVNSADTGVEKPRPEAFALARQFAGTHDAAVMIGDSYGVDVAGAENVGIPGVLIRNHDPRALRVAPDAAEAIAIARRLLAN